MSPTPRSPLDAMLRRLARKPGDARLRERTARALFAAERGTEAVALLREAWINLTAHAPRAGLPCQCAACIKPEVSNARAGGVAYRRDFALSDGRVLYFWVPEALAGRQRRVRRSVAAAVQHGLWSAWWPAWRPERDE